ncbi:hypothetical protein O181_039967 [Austropuccinia psidii MF-1]|uniref:C2 domain-containing protein n=1 Tax=Austropuccinia psidii MF-1 TaxID=1389203 RepID=A0A9Q3DHU6_9BASI|nr:hypothetical protein [Austropuccinia psidii MF-1]
MRYFVLNSIYPTTSSSSTILAIITPSTSSIKSNYSISISITSTISALISTLTITTSIFIIIMLNNLLKSESLKLSLIKSSRIPFHIKIIFKIKIIKLAKPEFYFVLKPIRFHLNIIPGLSSFIKSQVHATLDPMMYDPNVFTLNLEQMLAGALVDSAIGVLQVTLVSAHGLKSIKIGGGTPDPYVTFSIGAQTNLEHSKKLENGEEEPVPETTEGVVRLVFHQAKELDYKRSGTSPLSPYAKIYKTPIIKCTKNPVYEVFTAAFVSNKITALVNVQMYDKKVGEDPLIGSVNTKLVDLLELTNGEQTLDWFSFSSSKSGKLRLTATWKGLMMAGAVNGARTYTPPIGVLKFWFDKAEDLKNVEALTGGKSDPYVRLMQSGIILARSQIHNNNLEPLFDEIFYVPVHSVKDSIRVEVMDYQHLTKDRSLGIFELEANNLIKVTKVDKLTSYHSTGKRHYSEYLKQEGKQTVVKGRIDFDVEFYPCLQMKFQPFDTCKSDAEKLKTDNTSEIASTVEAVFEDNVLVLNPTESNDLVRPSDRSVLNSKPNDDYSESIVEQVEQLNGPSLTSKSDQSDCKLKDDASIIKQPLNPDNGYWPSYSTEPYKSTHAKWDETGECFIRELEWSRCVLKLNVAEKDTREEVYAEYTSGLKPFLDDCLEGPHEFVLEDLEGGHQSMVSIQCHYIPIPITLEPRESINSQWSFLASFLTFLTKQAKRGLVDMIDMGILTVMLDHGKDLLASDCNGYLDPYAQFVLNRLKVFQEWDSKKDFESKMDGAI